MIGLYIGVAYIVIGVVFSALISWRSTKVPHAAFEGADWLIAALIWPAVLGWYLRVFWGRR